MFVSWNETQQVDKEREREIIEIAGKNFLWDIELHNFLPKLFDRISINLRMGRH